mmetsp:Transcript_15986/g.21132  ORF Transcript_15986/g.21132 Transcript_15986/m.21132 type:complete len:603 (-) Transcript_15986:319-2127(-)
MMIQTAKKYAAALLFMVNPTSGFTGMIRTFAPDRKSVCQSYHINEGARTFTTFSRSKAHTKRYDNLIPVRYFSMSADTQNDDSQLRKRTVPEHIIAENDIFCNRELKMNSLKAIGFDMDYTLAQYYESFDLLAYEGAKEKLVNKLGYPKEILEYVYDADFFVRGLVIDKEYGNVLKIDRHKYCRVAYHGFTPLTSEERKALYQSPGQLPTYTGDRFVNVDTLFTLVDAVLFSQLIELKDSEPDLVAKSYTQIYRDVRTCVDLCHRDGVIKKKVAEDPTKYIVQDKGVVEMLKHLKKEGFKVFLVTNSEWEYTDVVMNYLCGNVMENERNRDWIDLFDISFCLSCKPAFLVDPRRPLFRINTEAGTLENCDGVDDDIEEFLAEGKVFQMGSWKDLQKALNVTRGDEIMYVGDHMYSDVLRTKRTLGWRTCLVVPEMEREIESHLRAARLGRDVRDLRNLQYDLEEYVDDVAYDLRFATDDEEKAEMELRLKDLENQQTILKRILREKASLFHYQFHPVWGQIFKSGYQDSMFAKQISEYSCLYTSKASNLGYISARRSFRTTTDVLPHDHVMKQTDLGGATRISETKERIKYLATKYAKADAR